MLKFYLHCSPACSLADWLVQHSTYSSGELESCIWWLSFRTSDLDCQVLRQVASSTSLHMWPVAGVIVSTWTQKKNHTLGMPGLGRIGHFSQPKISLFKRNSGPGTFRGVNSLHWWLQTENMSFGSWDLLQEISEIQDELSCFAWFRIRIPPLRVGNDI